VGYIVVSFMKPTVGLRFRKEGKSKRADGTETRVIEYAIRD